MSGTVCPWCYNVLGRLDRDHWIDCGPYRAHLKAKRERLKNDPDRDQRALDPDRAQQPLEVRISILGDQKDAALKLLHQVIRDLQDYEALCENIKEDKYRNRARYMINNIQYFLERGRLNES